eukprot:1157986-Pelagomonas_calceolata.AAC.4
MFYAAAAGHMKGKALHRHTLTHTLCFSCLALQGASNYLWHQLDIQDASPDATPLDGGMLPHFPGAAAGGSSTRHRAAAQGDSSSHGFDPKGVKKGGNPLEAVNAGAAAAAEVGKTGSGEGWNATAAGGVEAMITARGSVQMGGDQPGPILGAQARLGSSHTVKPQQKTREGSTEPAEEESGVGQQGCVPGRGHAPNGCVFIC